MDRNAAKVLKRCETDSIALENCLAPIREWTDKEGSQSNRRKRWVALSIRRDRRLVVSGGLPWHR